MSLATHWSVEFIKSSVLYKQSHPTRMCDDGWIRIYGKPMQLKLRQQFFFPVSLMPSPGFGQYPLKVLYLTVEACSFRYIKYIVSKFRYRTYICINFTFRNAVNQFTSLTYYLKFINARYLIFCGVCTQPCKG